LSSRGVSAGAASPHTALGKYSPAKPGPDKNAISECGQIERRHSHPVPIGIYPTPSFSNLDVETIFLSFAGSSQGLSRRDLWRRWRRFLMARAQFSMNGARNAQRSTFNAQSPELAPVFFERLKLSVER
jgi:hypothetical protein